MSALPTLNVGVVVNTDQVPKALKKVEQDVASAASRVGKIKAAVMPGLGALGAGPLGSVLGGAVGLGGGAAATAGFAAMFMAPILAAGKLQDALDAQAKGASEAFDEFKKTGQQSAQINSVLLERLAKIEGQQKGNRPMGFMAAFAQAEIAVQNANFTQETSAEWWDKRFTEAGAFSGAIMGGASPRRAWMEAELSTAGQGVALQLQEEINRYKSGTPGRAIEESTMLGPGMTYIPREVVEMNRKQVELQQQLVRQGI